MLHGILLHWRGLQYATMTSYSLVRTCHHTHYIVAALNEAGYNKSGGRTIPVFGIDATEAARAKIAEGKMAGTVRQDGAGMAAAIMQIVTNMQSGKGALEGLDTKNTVGGWRVNIPYSLYTGEK